MRRERVGQSASRAIFSLSSFNVASFCFQIERKDDACASERADVREIWRRFSCRVQNTFSIEETHFPLTSREDDCLFRLSKRILFQDSYRVSFWLFEYLFSNKNWRIFKGENRVLGGRN